MLHACSNRASHRGNVPIMPDVFHPGPGHETSLSHPRTFSIPHPGKVQHARRNGCLPSHLRSPARFPSGRTLSTRSPAGRATRFCLQTRRFPSRTRSRNITLTSTNVFHLEPAQRTTCPRQRMSSIPSAVATRPHCQTRCFPSPDPVTKHHSHTRERFPTWRDTPTRRLGQA